MIKQINIKKILFLFFFAGIFFLGNISSVQAEYLYIDDFEDGNILNNLNYAWYLYSYALGTSSATVSNTNPVTNGGIYGSAYSGIMIYKINYGGGANYTGIGLGTRLIPDYTGANTNIDAPTIDLSAYDNGQIAFWVKGPNSPNWKAQIRTKTIDEDSGKSYTHFEAGAIGSSWTRITIPFKWTDDGGGNGSANGFDQPNWATPPVIDWLQSISNSQKFEFQYADQTISGRIYIDDFTVTSYTDNSPPPKVSSINGNNGPIPCSISFSFPVPVSDIYKYVCAYSTNSSDLNSATNEANFTVAPNHKTLYAKVETGTETLHLYGLIPGETYYFRFVACDRAANYSTNISEIVSGTATPVTDPVYPALIIDTCEDGDDRNELGATWYTFDDHADPNYGNSTITPSPDNFVMTANGYQDSGFGKKYCASYSYELGDAYQYRFVGMATSIPVTYKDFNNYTGIAFYVKGTGQKSQRIRINSSFNDLLGNYDYFCYTIDNTTDEWKWYVLPFTAFKQEGWGTPLNLTSVLSNVEAIVFVPPSQISGESEQVWYDDIVLLKGDINSLVKTISISPEKIHLIPGETKTFTVVGKDENGNDIPVTGNLTWEVVEGDAGTIKNTGEFIAMQYGYTRIKVTTGIKDSAGNNLTAYATADVLGDRLFDEGFTIGPNFINTVENPDLYPRIRFYLKANQEAVTLEVFNETGHLIRTIIDKEPVDSGVNGINWDLKDNKGDKVSSGLYIIRISCPVLIKAQKVVIVN